MKDIEVEELYGSVVVKAEDGYGDTHRWWFERTDADRLVIGSQVVENEDGIRAYVELDDLRLPDEIQDRLESEYNGVYGPRGKEL